MVHRLGSRALEDLHKACVKGDLDVVETLMKMAGYTVYAQLKELIDVSTEDVIEYIIDKYGVSRIGKLYEKINPDKRIVVVDKMFDRRKVLQEVKGNIKTVLEERILKELLEACASGNYECVVKLLDTGIDEAKVAPCIEVAINNDRQDIVQLLCDRCIRPVRNNTEVQQHTVAKTKVSKSELLIHEIKAGNRKELQKILRTGVDVNASVDEKNRTMLMLAIDKDDVDTVMDLLNMGADVNAVDKDGISVIMYAINKGNVSLVDSLLDRPVRLDMKDKKKRTVLMYALKKGKSMSCLIDGMINEYNANYTDKKGTSMLMCACAGGYMKAIEYIVSQGVDVDETDYNGNTALGVAFSKNNMEVMRYLIMNGATNPGSIEKKNEVYKLIGKIERGESLEDEPCDKDKSDMRAKNNVSCRRQNNFVERVPNTRNNARKKSMSSLHKR